MSETGSTDVCGQSISLETEIDDDVNCRTDTNNVMKTLDYNVGDFDLIRYIGRGSFSKVFLVKSKSNGGLYAMKAIRKVVLTSEDGYGTHVIEYEKSVFAIAEKGPFLVKLLTMFDNDSHFFFVMEYIGGGDLYCFLNERGTLSEADTQFYAAEICTAVAFLHDNGFIHRDLKTANVLIDYNGHIKVADYGTCFKGLSAKTVVGTITYSAPEMYLTSPFGRSVDWWSVGVIVYELLIGDTPFAGTHGLPRSKNSGLSSEKDMSLEAQVRVFQLICDLDIKIPPNISPAASNIIHGFLTRDPCKRLGCVKPNNEDILQHSFFENVDWQKVQNCEMCPPFIPFTHGRPPTDYVDF